MIEIAPLARYQKFILWRDGAVVFNVIVENFEILIAVFSEKITRNDFYGGIRRPTLNLPKFRVDRLLKPIFRFFGMPNKIGVDHRIIPLRHQAVDLRNVVLDRFISADAVKRVAPILKIRHLLPALIDRRTVQEKKSEKDKSDRRSGTAYYSHRKLIFIHFDSASFSFNFQSN
jgi:hypothetical protein